MMVNILALVTCPFAFVLALADVELLVTKVAELGQFADAVVNGQFQHSSSAIIAWRF